MTQPAPSLARIKTLDLVLTSRCNLKCGYCFQNDKKDLSMAWETARAGLDLALGSAEPRVEIIFFGGEPTLEFETVRRAVDYLAARSARGKTIQLSLLTNGTLLGPAEIDFLADHRFDVQLSFDGVPQMQIFRGKGTHERLDALLDTMRARRPYWFARHLSVAMTLVSRTVPWLAESVEYFLAKGVRDLAITPKVTPDPHFKPEMIEDLREQFRRIFRASVVHYRKTGRVPLLMYRKAGPARNGPRPGTITMCGVMTGQRLAIDVDGQTHGCILFAESYQSFPAPTLKERLASMKLGDVRSGEIGERLPMYPGAVKAAGIFHDKQDKASSYARCGDCRYLGTCSVCPMSIGYANGGTDPSRVPDFLCAYNLVALASRDRFPLTRPAPRRRTAATAIRALGALQRS